MVRARCCNVLLAAALFVMGPASASAQSAAQPDSPVELSSRVGADGFSLFAIEYARSHAVREARLVRGGGAAVVDMSWNFYLIVGGGRVILVDCGTDALSRPNRASLRARWSIAEAVSVVDALARVSLEPDDVTDVVLTHHHWDHVGALGHFSRAQVHVHEREWRRVPARLRAPVEASGRLRAMAGSEAEIAPGLTLRRAGRHTPDHSMVDLVCDGQTFVIAGDAAYLRRNVREERPVTVTSDRQQNVRDVRDAARRAGVSNVLPGHDPAVFADYPSGVSGVAEICVPRTGS